tara:strand:+ start:3526 stop:4230 length:705 start_codon:yes stop_codon:yes gene_type:complete
MNKQQSQQQSIDHFNTLAKDWWRTDGPLKTLHTINPFRLQYIGKRCQINDRSALDVGCGGGILSESLARFGAKVTGIDLAEQNIQVAKDHAHTTGLDMTYLHTSSHDIATQNPGSYQIITCMELLEHVPEPTTLIADCVAACRPGGDLFFSTINRTPKAFLHAIVGAEYITNLIPRGTHQYRQLITPSELTRWLEAAGATVQHIQGFHYAAFTGHHRLTDNVAINYMLHATKPS